MRIEKVSENQIRCTLTKDDLVSRQLKISELAYGTEKAKSLFRDMMRQASFEFGFDAENMPLMIEAIPMNADCIVLIITKVEDPEELDTRFSRFAPSVTEDIEDEDEENLSEEQEDREVLDLFHRIQAEGGEAKKAEPKAQEDNGVHIRLFAFRSLRQVMQVATLLGGRYQGKSALYKDEAASTYLLLLSCEGTSKEAYDRACNIISEYASSVRTTTAVGTFLSEHYEALIEEKAIESLGSM